MGRRGRIPKANRASTDSRILSGGVYPPAFQRLSSHHRAPRERVPFWMARLIQLQAVASATCGASAVTDSYTATLTNLCLLLSKLKFTVDKFTFLAYYIEIHVSHLNFIDKTLKLSEAKTVEEALQGETSHRREDQNSEGPFLGTRCAGGHSRSDIWETGG